MSKLIKKMKNLTREFFLQSTDDVAKQLLGKMIRIKKGGHIFRAVITETESYHGDDPASHAARKRTLRNEPMFWCGGHLYIYLIYGIHYCLNITTESKDYPAAVLIRAVKIIEPEKLLLDGPGKVCRYLAIDKSFNFLDICSLNNGEKFNIFDIGLNLRYKAEKRVGISQNKDALLRFLAEDDDF